VTRDEILAKLVSAFGSYEGQDPQDKSCMVVFQDTDGENSLRTLRYGEIADALASDVDDSQLKQ
jgi:hypothetical protein